MFARIGDPRLVTLGPLLRHHLPFVGSLLATVNVLSFTAASWEDWLTRTLQSQQFQVAVVVVVVYLSDLSMFSLHGIGMLVAAAAALGRLMAGPLTASRAGQLLFVLSPAVDLLMNSVGRSPTEMTDAMDHVAEGLLGVAIVGGSCGLWLGAQHDEHVSHRSKLVTLALHSALSLSGSIIAVGRTGDKRCLTLWLLWHHLPCYVCFFCSLSAVRATSGRALRRAQRRMSSALRRIEEGLRKKRGLLYGEHWTSNAEAAAVRQQRLESTDEAGACRGEHGFPTGTNPPRTVEVESVHSVQAMRLKAAEQAAQLRAGQQMVPGLRIRSSHSGVAPSRAFVFRCTNCKQMLQLPPTGGLPDEVKCGQCSQVMHVMGVRAPTERLLNCGCDGELPSNASADYNRKRPRHV